MKNNQVRNLLVMKLEEAKRKLQEKKDAERATKESSEGRTPELTPDTNKFTIAETAEGTIKGELVILEPSSVTSSLEASAVEVENEQLNKNQITFAHLNEEQRLAVTLGTSGHSFVVIGPAGSGKTTTQRVLLEELARSGRVGQTKNSTKAFPIGSPTVLITSFTKVATRNIKDAAPSAFKQSCVNIHKAIEYSPVSVDKQFIAEDGEAVTKSVQVFQPLRNRYNPLSAINYCIIEESGSVDTGLFLNLVDALPRNCVYIFLGDLNQIPPVYGAAILGFAIAKLPVVELKTTYRANVGPIKQLAQDILKGQRLPASHIQKLSEESKPGAELILKPMTKKNNGLTLNKGLGDYMRKEVFAGNFIPGESCFLTPIRKDERDLHNINEMNRHIAQALTEQRGEQTYEIISRSSFGTSFYYAVGDLVFYEREYYEVTDIQENTKYVNTYGYDFKPASTTLTRWGVDPFAHDHDIDFGSSHDEINSLVKDVMDMNIDELMESKQIASHILTLRSWGTDPEDTVSIVIKTPGDLNKIALGYAQTLHSAQGSEWRNVYISTPHAVMFMLNREMIYTAVTRARQRLVLFYEDGSKPYNFTSATFDAGIKRQAIKGTKLKDKVKYFKELNKKREYKYIPALLDELNKKGTMSIESYYSYDDQGYMCYLEDLDSRNAPKALPQ